MNKIFGLKHIIIVCVSVALIVGLFFLSKKFRFETLCKFMFGLAIVCEVVKVFAYVIMNEERLGGILPKSDLPFQLCSIQLIFFAILIFSKNEKIKKWLYSFMLPSCLFGGIAAILIATSSSLNVWVITFQYFFYHIGLVVFALNLFTRKEISFDVSDYFKCLIFLGGIFMFAIYINSICYDGVSTVNFMYVVDPPQKGLPFLNEDSGWLVYMLRYAALVLVCITGCYIKHIITAIKTAVKNRKSVKVFAENTEDETTENGEENK